MLPRASLVLTIGSLVLALVTLSCGEASATLLYSEAFPQDFSLTGGNASSVAGQLHLTPFPAPAGNTINFTVPGPAAGVSYTLSGDVTATSSNGGYNVGILVGQNPVVFHPGLAGGALRVEGAGGFGNTNVGFTPANLVLHPLRITSDGTGNFGLTLTNGANPANVFNAAWTNPGSLGGAVGFRRSGPGADGIYDNLSLVPSSGPSTLMTFDNAFSTSLNEGSAGVSGGVLSLNPRPTPPNTDQFWNIGAFSPALGDVLVSVDVGANTSNVGSYNVGLVIGGNRIVFHPGYAGAAFRVEGTGGFGNTNVGFTPAMNVLHHLEVREAASGLFQITLTDGSNPSNVFRASFFNPASVGGAVSLLRSGEPTGPGLYDNLFVNAVPEPSSLALGALGAAGLLVPLVRRRRRLTRAG